MDNMELSSCHNAMQPTRPPDSVLPCRGAASWLFFVLSILLGIGSFTATAQEETTSGVAVLLEIEGKVEIRRAGAQRWDPSHLDQQLDPGDQLRTGERSRAAIRLQDQTICRLGELSFLQMPEAETESHWTRLWQGVFFFLHRDEPGKVQFRTPTVSAVIRGTEFAVRVSGDGTTRVSLLDGEVNLGNEHGELEMTSGEEAVVEPGRPPVRTAKIATSVAIQWCLYYPAVLYLDELGLSEGAREVLADSVACYREGDLPGALEAYPPGRSPQSPEEGVYLGALLLAVGDVEEAEANLDRVGKEASGRAVRLAGAVQRMRDAVLGVPVSLDVGEASEFGLATEWLAESYVRQYAGSAERALERALEAARAAVETAPEFGFARARVAELEFSFGRIGAARESLDRALSLAPQNAQAHALMGFLWAAENRLTAAREAFDEAIDVDGALGNAWFGRGLVRIRQGEVEKGREDLQMAAALEPQRALFRSYLGKAFARQKDPELALKELELAMRLDPRDPTAHLYAALIHRQQNRINAAVRELETSKRLNANRRIFRSRQLLDQDRAVRSANLAAIYAEAGMKEFGFREAMQALNHDPANSAAHLFLADSYNALREPGQTDLRYESAWLSEFLTANLMAPVGAGSLSQNISQGEYSRLFEQDGPHLSTFTSYESRGDWTQLATQYGTFGNLSYAADVSYFSFNGQRVNHDLESMTVSAQVKYQLTPRDSIYIQGIYYDFESGDRIRRYDPHDADPNRRIEENQEPMILLGYHHEWQPGVHTLFLAGRLADEQSVRDPDYQTLAVFRDIWGDPVPGRITSPFHYESEAEIYTAEIQQIWHQDRHAVITGLRYQNGSFEVATRAGESLAYDDLGNSLMAYRDLHSPNLERFSAYGYYHWQALETLSLTFGLSYDDLRFPLNHRLFPVSGETRSVARVLPKVGLTWTPWRDTTIQAAYARSLGGVSFDQSFRLEPTQVAGINQTYRSVIPEAVAGSLAGEEFDVYGVALKQKVFASTYLGLEGEIIESDATTEAGAWEIDANAFPPNTPSGLPWGLDYRETNLRAYVNQLIEENWSLGAAYQLSYSELESRLTLEPGETLRTDPEALLHQVRLHARYNHESGVFGLAEALWNYQSNRHYEPDLEGEDFWHLNLYVGYRYPRRRWEATLGVLNITDQDYRLNPLNFYQELPRKRTIAVSFRMNF